MNQRQRTYLAGGVLLMLMGIVMLVFQKVPELQRLLALRDTWPLVVIGIGVGLLVFGVLIGAPRMAVPAIVFVGIGGILLGRSLTAHEEIWNYAIWALTPLFVWVGIMIARMISKVGPLEILASHLRLLKLLMMVLLGNILLLVSFRVFLRAFDFISYWPWVLIVLGMGLIVISWWRSASPKPE